MYPSLIPTTCLAKIEILSVWFMFWPVSNKIYTSSQEPKQDKLSPAFIINQGKVWFSYQEFISIQKYIDWAPGTLNHYTRCWGHRQVLRKIFDHKEIRRRGSEWNASYKKSILKSTRFMHGRVRDDSGSQKCTLIRVLMNG